MHALAGRVFSHPAGGGVGNQKVNATGGIAVTINTAATPEQVTVSIPAVPNAPNGRLFARLRASQP